MTRLAKRFNEFFLFISLLFALYINYLNHGSHFQVFLLPILISATTHTLARSAAVAILCGVISFYPGSTFLPLLLVRTVMFALTAIFINILFKKQTLQKDNLIKQLSINLDLNKTLQSLILNDSKSAVEVIDSRGSVISCNERFLQFVGSEQAVGKFHSALLAQTAGEQSLVLDTLNSGREYLDCEITLNIPEKGNITALVSTYVLRNNEGKTMGALAIYRDITEKKLLERKLQQEDKFEALGQMAAGLAHEIRNPLTTVKGFLQLISPEHLGPKYSEYRELMLEEVNRTNRLVSNLILLSNPSAPVFKPTDLKKLTQSVLLSIEGKAKARKVTLQNLVPKLPLVYIDEEQIGHLLLYLADNSLDAMPQGGSLSVRAKPEGDSVFVEVVDTGSGIPPAVMDKIFDPFFTTKDDGAGLGLSIGYHIVKSHNGSLSVLSQPGAGTAITISLPVHHPATYLSGILQHQVPEFREGIL